MKKAFLFIALTCIFITCFSLATTASNVTPRAITTNEIEPNNYYTNAQIIYSDYTVSGTLTYLSTNDFDVDIYKIVFPISGTANFWIGDIPSSADIDLLISDENYNEVGFSGGEGTQELVTLSVEEGDIYYIEVYPYSISATSSYTLRSKVSPINYAHYSQTYMTGFNTTNLTNLYQNSTSTKSMYQLIDDEGCVMCSLAMVLKNMSKQTISPYYDYRNGQTSYLIPDPFTVSMANCNFPTITHDNTSGRDVLNTSFNPIALQSSTRIGNYFDATPKQLLVGNLSAQEKAKVLAYYIAHNPEGITAWYGSSTNNHTIVFTGTTYQIDSTYVPPQASTDWSINDDIVTNTIITSESLLNAKYVLENKLMGTYSNNTTYGSYFTVYDPAGNGNGVLFNQSWTATNKGWDTLYRIVYFD